MIDSVALTWGTALGSAARSVDAPAAGRRREALAEPVKLDWAMLRETLGDGDGQVRAIAYKAGVSNFGHWKVDDIEILYRDGRLELRASLPKIVHGRNDVVLDEAGVHRGLAQLTAKGAELVQTKLDLREAVPTRLDYCFQWEVPSVAWIVEHLRAAYRPARKLRTENLSPFGGRSITWGYGSSRVIRFYDKGAEVFDRERRETFYPHGIPQATLARMDERAKRAAIATAVRRAQEEAFKAARVDNILRYEIQDRRRGRLRLVHENGYRAADIRHELAQTVEGLASTAARDFAGLLDTYDGWVHDVAYTAAAFHFAEHEGDLAVVRNRKDRRTFYNWRRRAKDAGAFMVGTWRPTIPPDAFLPPSTVWQAAAA